MTDGPTADSSLLPHEGLHRLFSASFFHGLSQREASSLAASSDQSSAISLCSGVEGPCSAPIDARVSGTSHPNPRGCGETAREHGQAWADGLPEDAPAPTPPDMLFFGCVLAQHLKRMCFKF